MTDRLPKQRWQIAPPTPEQVDTLVQAHGLSPLMAQAVINRGHSVQTRLYLDPELQQLPNPLVEFPDLELSVALLKEAILTADKIAICGDYDADGMTSTALLLRALRHLGAEVEYAIPSRMKDGYGINKRIVKEFANGGVGLILTVDNGISAVEPVALAIELGMSVIITDHHDLPDKLPPADAILNPKLLPEASPYRGLAGVGVAYILAVTTAQSLGQLQGLTDQLLELFTLGTIADLAPLVGVNRRWLKRGLRRLPQSKLAGVQALMQMAGVSDEQKKLKPDDIGFRLGPRINAVGRLADPQIVIELLTTDDPGVALERAMQCEQINRTRQQLCEQIEAEAIASIETTPIDWHWARVLVLVQANWHHGVIGIVASRLVERYGVPVFIGTYEDTEQTTIRGSARGTQEFHVFAALDFCEDLLGKYGGHQAAGGFSLSAQNLGVFKQQLSAFAHRCLQPEHLQPLVKIDAQANFNQINLALYQEIDRLQPWGIGNDFPVFWTANVRVIEQKVVGKHHLKLSLAQSDEHEVIRAIVWRWGDYFPLPSRLDIAYKLRENIWNGNTSIELEIVGARLPDSSSAPAKATLRTAKDCVPNLACPTQHPEPLPGERRVRHLEVRSMPEGTFGTVSFQYRERSYACSLWNSNELRIKNAQGKVLAVNRGQRNGVLGHSRDAKTVDVTQPHYYGLIKAALAALAKTQR